MARLNHPNVVTVHDAGTHDNQPYVAMEFVVGQDLEAWLRAGDRGWRRIVAVFADFPRPHSVSPGTSELAIRASSSFMSCLLGSDSAV